MSPALAAGGYAGDSGDFRVMNDWVYHERWIHPLVIYFGTDGWAFFLVMLVIGWWIARRDSRPETMVAVAWAGIGALVAVAINQPLTHVVAEPRPFVTLRGVHVLVKHAADYGFTSDHATLAGGVAAGLGYANRRLAEVTWLFAAFIAFCRVGIGAHYPHDVVAGLGLGAGVVIVGGYLARPLLAWLYRLLLETPLRAVLAADPQEARGRRLVGARR